MGINWSGIGSVLLAAAVLVVVLIMIKGGVKTGKGQLGPLMIAVIGGLIILGFSGLALSGRLTPIATQVAGFILDGPTQSGTTQGGATQQQSSNFGFAPQAPSPVQAR